jgi:GTP cyclohydrolase I
MELTTNPFKESISDFIASCGEDPGSERFEDTPDRFYKGMMELCGGYRMRVEDYLKVFSNEYNYESIIVSKNIEFHSLCAHHMLPFYGYAHIGYLPGTHIYGLSKLARVVDIFSKRFQEQEKLTVEIAETLMKHADIKGVIVVVEGRHTCSCGRGVKKPQSSMMTLCQKGTLRDDEHQLQRFLTMIQDRQKL